MSRECESVSAAYGYVTVRDQIQALKCYKDQSGNVRRNGDTDRAK